MKSHWSTVFRPPIALLYTVLIAVPCTAQSRATPEDTRYAELADKLDQMLSALTQTQQELADSRKQMQELARQLESLKAEVAYAHEATTSASPTAGAADMQAAVRQLQENTEILQAEVKQHDQTKVESSSKYPVKITGMLLSTTNLNDGAVDNVDLPTVALPRSDSVAHGSLATSWRQTVLGLDAYGPTLGGGHSSADIRADFFGGQTAGGYGTNAGLLRLRTAHARLDWPQTKLIVSLDSPLISPLNPTSYLTVAEPALAWSGNLWSWVPQLEFQHSIPTSERGSFGFEFGLMDPAATSYFNQALRQANPSESSKQPGYELRTFYTLGSTDRALTIAASGYYSRQKYPYQQHIDSWAGTADWRLPLANRLELSGELYRGRALGSLGGGAFKDYVYEAEDQVLGLDDEGGWTQLKARFSSQMEANVAIGQDSAFASQVREAIPPAVPNIYSNLTANRTLLGNVIFRPRTYLLLSLEYRRIWSWQVAYPTSNSQTMGLAIGYLY